MQKSLNLPVFKRYKQCSIAQPSIAFLSMGQICHLRNRFPLSNSVVVLEPILKTAFESDICKEEGLVSALLIHMGLLKVITLISLVTGIVALVSSFWLAPQKSRLVDKSMGVMGACVLASRGWRIKCGKLRVVRLKVSPCFSSRNIAARSLNTRSLKITIIITSPIKSSYYSCPDNLSC